MESLDWGRGLVKMSPEKFEGEIVRDPSSAGAGSVWFYVWDGATARVYEKVDRILESERRECSGTLSLSFDVDSAERYEFRPTGPQATAEVAKIFVTDYDTAGRPTVVRQIHPRSALILHGPQHQSSNALDRRSIYKEIDGFALWVPSFSQAISHPHEFRFRGPGYPKARHLRPLLLQTVKLSSRLSQSVTQHSIAPKDLAAKTSRAISVILGFTEPGAGDLVTSVGRPSSFGDVKQWELVQKFDGSRWVVVSTRQANASGHALTLRIVDVDIENHRHVRVVADPRPTAVDTCSLTGVELRRDLFTRTGKLLAQPVRDRVNEAMGFLYG